MNLTTIAAVGGIFVCSFISVYRSASYTKRTLEYYAPQYSSGRITVSISAAVDMEGTDNNEEDQVPPNIITSMITTNSSIQPVDYFSSHEYRKSRNETYDSWFKPGTGKLLENADKNGPILDFAIAGFAKCGTTTLEVNLGYLAPMPIADVCTPVHQTVYYTYKNWPKEYGKEKLLRGTKCPNTISGDDINAFSYHLPRTKLIIGIRHPILWFQSFWNMQKRNKAGIYESSDPMKRTKPCGRGKCTHMCPDQIFCMHRGRFHISLAQLGKTALSKDERKLLAPNDFDGGENVKSRNSRNPIFLIEQNQLKEDYIWNELAIYLNVPSIPHGERHGSGSRSTYQQTNVCDEKFDNFRAMMMPYAYELSMWLQDYFIPVAKNESSDVTIPDPDIFADLVATYKKDPCNRLYRLHNGTYVLNSMTTNFTEVTYTT